MLAPSPPLDLPVPPPRMTGRGVALAAAMWLAFSLLYTVLVISSGGTTFWGVFIGELMMVGLMAGLSIPIWYVLVRRMDTVPWYARLLVHLAVAPVYAWVVTEAYFAMLEAYVPAEIASGVRQAYVWIWLQYATIYALQFALYHGARAWQRVQLREKQALEWMALARERELASLRAQVNPHFLFNTLNAISATVGRDPEVSRAMLARLADLMRYALDSTRCTQVTLRDELDVARAYLALEQHRLRDRLHVKVEADDALLDAPLPPMTLQPLVENAVRHGLAPAIEGGTVRIEVARVPEGIRVVVEDDGQGGMALGDGAHARTAGGVGLVNTTARLAALRGQDARLHTERLVPHGFRVWFTLPSVPSPVDA